MSSATRDYGASYATPTSSSLDRLGAALARNWWLIGVRGLLGVVFGTIALIMPIATILALVLLFAAYMLVDGAFTLYAAVRAARQREQWGLLAVQGIASIAAGVVAFSWPGITVLAFVLLIAAWSIVSGCIMLAAGLQTEAGRWWLILDGIPPVWPVDDYRAADRSHRADLVARHFCAGVWYRPDGAGVEIAVSIQRTSDRCCWRDGCVMPRQQTEPHQQTEPRQEDRDLPDARPTEEMIDESLKETFPASDPPSSALRARIGPPKRTSNDT